MLSPRQIFISHSHEDAQSARSIADHFTNSGLKCWLDQSSLRVGQLYDERIQKAIWDSGAVLVLVSRAAAASDYVKYEITTALNRKIPIAPVFLENVPKQELKPPLDFGEIRVHALMLSRDDLNQHLPKLTQQVSELLEQRRRRLMFTCAAIGLLLLVVVGFGVWALMLRKSTEVANARVSELQKALGAASPALRVIADPSAAPPLVPTAFKSAPELQFQVYGLPKDSEGWVALSNGSELASGEAFFIQARPLTDGYLYVFQQDSSGKTEWLFPSNPSSTNSYGTNPVGSTTTISLPVEEGIAYALDDVTGEEHFFAVFSASPWPELEKALLAAGRTTNHVPLGQADSETLLATAKGMAGQVKVAAPRTAARSLNGRSLPVPIEPIALRSKSHWLVVHSAIRHVPRR